MGYKEHLKGVNVEQIPSIAIDNKKDILSNGERWIGELWATIFAIYCHQMCAESQLSIDVGKTYSDSGYIETSYTSGT